MNEGSSENQPAGLDFQWHLAEFDMALAAASGPEDVWRALRSLTGAVAGFKLFTVMTVDLANDVARRVYTSHPLEYPVSGTKPIQRDSWFEIVHGRQELFIANTIDDIAKVFPDHQKIWAMGCGSVVNLPVVIAGDLAATINMLHAENYYGPDRIRQIVRHLTDPARRAYLAASAWN